MKGYLLITLATLTLASGGALAGAQDDGRQGGGRQGRGAPAPVPPPVRNEQGVLIETPPPGNIQNGETYRSKVDTAPAGSARGAARMRHTPRHGEWVDIPAGR